MLKASKRIIVTSERLNRHGFRVLTDGVDFSQYEKNPLMLWMHLRAFRNDKDAILPIGNVVDLKRENHPEYGKVITGQPMFDDTDPFAKKIYDKFENGTIRMCSAGLDPNVWSDDPKYILPGQRGFTLAKSWLKEISLADMGSNDDALQVALYDNKGELITLSDNSDNGAIPQLTQTENQSNIKMKTIQLNAPELLVKLGLADSASAAEVEAKILEVVNLNSQQADQLKTLSEGKLESEKKIKELNDQIKHNDILALVEKAENERRITAGEKEHLISLAKMDRESVEKLLESRPATASVEVQLAEKKADVTAKYKGKSWNDLDKSGDLVQLKNDDPELYKALYVEKFGKEPSA